MSTAYLVRRLAWDNWQFTSFSSSEAHQLGLGNPSGPRHVPVAVFGTPADAEECAERLSREVRDNRGPFWFASDWALLSTLDPEDITSRLWQLNPPLPDLPVPGLSPKKKKSWKAKGQERRRKHFYEWREWWDRESGDWTAEQLADAWAVFDKLRFYDVVEIELEG